jgi:hypothetical protein
LGDRYQPRPQLPCRPVQSLVAWRRHRAHAPRAALQKLFENSVSGLEATNEPKASQPENKPDFLLRKSNSPIGYAEAKDLGVALPAVLRSAQIRRYQVCEKWLKDRKGRTLVCKT